MEPAYHYRKLLPVVMLLLAGCSTAVSDHQRSVANATGGPVPPAVPAYFAAAGDNPASSNPAPSDAPATRPAAAQPAQTGPVAIRAALSHSAYTKSTPQSLLLKIDYQAAASVATDRPPLNIALVLDRSGSMAEDRKFPYTLEAAHWVIENMTDRDTLSIIAFNHEVTVLSAAGRVVNKQFLYHRLEEIAPEGYTDLSAGLLEGIAQVASQAAQGQVQQVFLLTDGMANKGVIDPGEMRGIARKAKARGIGLSTFGCGTEFNEKLLTDLANEGSGRYTYVKNSEQIPNAFKDELHGLLQVVGQNTAIAVNIKGGQIIKVYGQLLDQPTGSQTFTVGDVRSGERGVFLMKIQPSGFGSGSTVEANVRLTVDDPQAGERVNRELHQAASFTADAQAGQLQQNEDVVIYGGISDALQEAEEGVRGLDAQRYGQARASFDQWYERARQFALQNRDQELLNHAFVLKHFMGELAAAQQEGLLHGHNEAMEKLKKQSDYDRYLLTHHRPER